MSVDQEDLSIIDHGGLCRVQMSPNGKIKMAQFGTIRAVAVSNGYRLDYLKEGEVGHQVFGQYSNPSGILDRARESIFNRPSHQRIKELVVSPSTAARMAIEGAFDEDSLRGASVDLCYQITKIPNVWFDEGERSILVTVVVSYQQRGSSYFRFVLS